MEFELADDLYIKCKKCGKIIYQEKETCTPSESFYEHGDYGMGPEYLVRISDDIKCPTCRATISFELNASWYASDMYNVEPRITNGVFLREPYIKLIEEDTENEFYYWAFQNADSTKALILDAASDREYICYMDSREFEMMVERLYKDKGFITELTSQTRDGGKDIIARKHIGIESPITIYIECKRYSHNRPVGVAVVRNLFGVLTDEQINKAILVTSSYFSEEAISFAINQGNQIDLVNGDDLYRMIRKNANKYYNSKRIR